MQFIKVSLLSVAIIAIFNSTSCFASEVTHRAAIEEMLMITNADKLIDPMFDQFKGMLENQFNQMGVSEKDKPIFEKYNSKLFSLMKEEMAWRNMKNDFIDLYMKVYTEEEVVEINKFYKSRVGQKMIDKMPILMQETMALTQRNLQEIFPKIEQISNEMAREINSNR